MLIPALIALRLASLDLADPAPAPPAPPAIPAPTVRPPRPPRPPRAVPAPPAPAASPAPTAQLESHRQGDWPAAPSGKRVTLERKTSIDGALERIAGAAGWNLVANTGAVGDRMLVVTVKEAPVEEALDAVLEGTPLVATRRGSTVTVSFEASRPLPEIPTLIGFDRPSGKKFSGAFDETPVDDALRKVADAGAFSLVLPPGLTGTVNAQFRDAPVEEVLKAVLAGAGLSAQKDGSIVTVTRVAGARLVIRGGKRQLLFDGDQAEARSVQDLARAAREAAEALKDQAGVQGDGEQARPHRRGRKDKVLSGDTVIGPGERAKDVVVMRGNVRMEPGSTADQVTAILGSVELGPGAQVEREVVAILGDVHVSPGARVGGDAVSIGGKLVIDEGGEVDGQQTSVSVPGIGSLFSGIAPLKPMAARSPWLRAFSVLAEFGALFVLGLLILALAPRRLEAVTGALGHTPVKTLLVGLLGTVAMPVLTLLLVVTVIGIPLVAVQAIGVVVAGLMGFAALGLLVGRSLPIPVERGGQVARLAVGTAVVVLVFQLPVLGTLAAVAAWLYVFGAVLRTRFGQPTPGVLETTVAPPPPPAAA